MMTTGDYPKIIMIDDSSIHEIRAFEKIEPIEPMPEIRRSEKRNYPTLKETLRQNRRVKPGPRRR
jgi:hypothetical protein